MFDSTKRWLRIQASWFLLALCACSTSNVTWSDAADYFDETFCQTIFAFDDRVIPFTQNLRLEMRQPSRHPANPVLKRGEPGSVDALAVQFYGSIIRENGLFRMWYVATSDSSDAKTPWSQRWRPAYAESQDGVRWTKPELGLVDFAGNRLNNLIELDPAGLGFVNLKVLFDPDDPDPNQRYKMTSHVYFRGKRRLGTLAPFASADGLRWKTLVPSTVLRGELSKDSLVLPPIHFEPCGGLYKWNGSYFACGQNALNAPRSYQGRITRMYRSQDFVHWSSTSHVGFVRSVQHQSLGAGRSLEGEQNHEGISVWNRNNVLLGVYGRWQGSTQWKDISVDLGFVVSNDGLHFREPSHEWTFLKHGKDGQWDEGGLLQGQGFENVGEQTLIYYGAWDPRNTGQSTPSPRGGVGIAVLPRDRFADLRVELAGKGTGDYQLPQIRSEFVTSTINLASGAVPRFFCNASGLGEEACLRIELLDEHEMPLPKYSGAKAALVRSSGYQTPILWSDNDSIPDLPERIRLRVTFEGASNDQIRFHAIYVSDSAAGNSAAIIDQP